MSVHTKPKVYVADDDADVLGSLRFLLEADGFDVRTFRSGIALLNASDHAPVDCFVVDYKMPGMNGHELADELQAVRPEMQVLYVSGARDATVSKLNTEAVNFLAKPFTPDALVAKVNSLFQA